MGDEAGIEQFLKPLHLQRNGRLRAAQRIRRAGIAAQVDDADEGAEKIGRQVDSAQLPLLMAASSL